MDVDRPVDTHPQSAEQRPLYCCYWGEKAVVQTKKVSQIDRMYSAYAQPFVMLWELTHDPTLCHNCEVIKLMCANVQICMTCQKYCMFRGKTTCCVLLSGLCILRVFLFSVSLIVCVPSRCPNITEPLPCSSVRLRMSLRKQFRLIASLLKWGSSVKRYLKMPTFFFNAYASKNTTALYQNDSFVFKTGMLMEPRCMCVLFNICK